MLEFIFRRKIFRIKECAFCCLLDLNTLNCDVVYLHSNDSGDVTLPKGSIIQHQYTLVTDLKNDKDALLSQIKKNCRYEIRRSEREGAIERIYYGREIDDSLIDRFQKTYDEMFDSKGLSGYSFNRELVLKARQANAIVISCCTNANNENEIFHAYLCDERNCLLMYSASPLWNDDEKDRAKQIGMMNKYLHWKDIQYFKDIGVERYEWGGISSKEAPNGIDRFKMEFGGEVVQYNNYIIPKTILGHLYAYLVRRKIGEN